MGKVVTREWRKAKSAELEFAFVSAFRDNSRFGLNILGPLCLWQCFFYRYAHFSPDMRLLATLMVLVEAAVAGDWVGLMASDKEERHGTSIREVRERQAISMREVKNKKGKGNHVMDKSAGDLREAVEAGGLQCLQEELLLCTDQLTSTLKRLKILYHVLSPELKVPLLFAGMSVDL